eukprot:gene19930-26636_t
MCRVQYHVTMPLSSVAYFVVRTPDKRDRFPIEDRHGYGVFPIYIDLRSGSTMWRCGAELEGDEDQVQGHAHFPAHRLGADVVYGFVAGSLTTVERDLQDRLRSLITGLNARPKQKT